VKRFVLWALIGALAFAVAGCKKDEPEKLDLSKDTDDAATDIMQGEKVPADKVIPKTNG
jgi:hypothetical protein